jgi:hypothetical protein
MSDAEPKPPEADPIHPDPKVEKEGADDKPRAASTSQIAAFQRKLVDAGLIKEAADFQAVSDATGLTNQIAALERKLAEEGLTSKATLFRQVLAAAGLGKLNEIEDANKTVRGL